MIKYLQEQLGNQAVEEFKRIYNFDISPDVILLEGFPKGLDANLKDLFKKTYTDDSVNFQQLNDKMETLRGYMKLLDRQQLNQKLNLKSIEKLFIDFEE